MGDLDENHPERAEELGGTLTAVLMERNMTVPDFLPTLSAGAHDPEAGEACVMEYVSVLSGEDWTDRPECTHPLLAHEARTVNDDLGDHDRHLLIPLIARLFGTQDDSPLVRAHLRIRQVELLTRLLEPSAQVRARVLLDESRSWLDRESDDEAVSQAAGLVRQIEVDGPGLDVAHEEVHSREARQAWFQISGAEHAAEAYALAALVVAHQLAAVGECRANCAHTSMRARRRVKELSSLIDAYDEATGRIPVRLGADQLAELSRAIA